MTSNDLKAARALLGIDQATLAADSLVSVATIRRFEGGRPISGLHRDAVRRTVERAGAVFLPPGLVVEGHAIEGGVARRLPD